jgi:Membrane bound O-acyl transferase family
VAYPYRVFLRQLLLIQTAFQCTFAVVNYYSIVVPRRRRQELQSKDKGASLFSTLSYFIVGWAVVVPITLYFPYLVLETLHIRNKCIKLATGTTTLIVLFRTMEAMYGTSPHTVESSLSTYIIYYSSAVHFVWDAASGRRRRLSLAQLARNIGGLLATAMLLSALLSLEFHYKFEPFPSSNVDLQDFGLSWNLFSWSHMANMYVLAVLTYYSLSFGLCLSAIGEEIKGCIATEPIFLNPLWTSSSPSEFWGRKWNRMVHTQLKYGVFKPALQFVSAPMALMATFVMSGLFHDYAWTLMYYKYAIDDCQGDNASDNFNCYTPAPLKLTAFFLWNGIIMLLEKTPVGTMLGSWTAKWPRPVVSTLVVLTGLPVSHWYMGDWVRGGFFADLSIGMWILRKV